MLRLVEAEMRVAMALTGRTKIAAIDRTALVEHAATAAA
jgi:isopentenyl diphosphate isomerase/L-lactate dehydrogenase-like FMN-dependent dehydrogenase